jgi:(heptosyl)LPS beta-1,4-glucosyltransferase
MTFSNATNSSKLESVTTKSATQLKICPLSVIILTKNEEQFIERCIRSVDWADEKLVIDSGSVDQTKEIAVSLGASVYEQDWLGWSAQRNKGISLAKHDWVFILEADEIVTSELANSIQRVLSNSNDPHDGYTIDRRDEFLGDLMPNMRRPSKKRSCVRLFNRKHSLYDLNMKVHEEVRFSGQSIPLKGILLHWRGWTLDQAIFSCSRYGTIEAEELNENGYRADGLIILLRPTLRFLWCYLAKGGFRYGVPGLIYCMSRAVNEFSRYAKLWEMQNINHSIHPSIKIYEKSPISKN